MYLTNLSIVLLCNIIICCIADQRKGSTLVPKSIARISSRRVRSLLLPDHGSIKLTIGLGKALIGNSPKGLSLSWEIGHYYSGPSTIKDWLSSEPPKPLRKSSEISNITNQIDFSKPAQQKYFQANSVNYQTLVNPHYIPLSANSMRNPFSPMLYDRRPINVYHDIVKRSQTDDPRASLEGVLTSLLRTDVKCGILRAICRSRQYLLPPGYSMVQDIIRIMFLMPTHNRDSVEVPLDLCDSTSYCDLDNEHSFNILDWLLNPIKVN